MSAPASSRPHPDAEPSAAPLAREDTAKRRQILEGARVVFLKDGFDAASMNEIARVSGVSKGTLYVYFPSKEALFADLIRQEKREQAEQTCAVDLDDKDVAAVMRAFGERLVDRICRDTAIAHLRTVVAVAPKFPAIGRAFFEAGPLYGQLRLRDYLAEQARRGAIQVDDPDRAAWFFLDLCKSAHLLPVLLHVAPPPSPAEIRAHVAAALAMFLRAYPLGQPHP